MAYKIFLSYAADEIELAEFVKDSITNAFRGNISFFMASDDILPGDVWKAKTKNVLQEYNCIMTLLTAKYSLRPWAYVEWASFWISDKKFYTLVTDDVKIDEVFEPMRERQLTEMFSENKVKQLFEALAQDAVTNKIPYDTAAKFHTEAKLQYTKVLEGRDRLKYGIYREKFYLLENDDKKREDVFWYYYEKEYDREMLEKVFSVIADNYIKTNILMRLLDRGAPELVETLQDKITVKSNLYTIFCKAIAIKKDSSLVDKLIESATDSQEVLRNMGQFLVQNGLTSSLAMTNIIRKFTNMAELKKIGFTLIENGYSGTTLFDSIMSKLYERNRAEARNLLINIIHQIDKFTPKEMIEHITKLSKINKTEASKIPEFFLDNETFREISVVLLANKVLNSDAEDKLRNKFNI